MNKSVVYLFLAGLAGCYAQIEDTDVAYTKSSVCGTPSACPANNATLNSTNFTPPIPVDLGNGGLLTSSQSKQGPITFSGGLMLNQAVVVMTTPDNGDFSGLRSVDVRGAAPGDTCAQLSAKCKSVASYDSARDGVAQKRLVLKGMGVNLSDLADSSNQFTIYVRATGNAPAVPSWNADVELDLAIKARGSFP